MTNSHWHVIAYDIKDSKRLQRVHRILSKIALPFQKSIFLILSTEKNINKLLNRLNHYINEKEDDIRTYPVDSIKTFWIYGLSATPDLVTEPMNTNTWQRTKKWLSTLSKGKKTEIYTNDKKT